MADHSFQITLPSNSSSRYFPDNQANHFQVRVPNAFTLQGEWEAALEDIQFDNYWLYLLSFLKMKRSFTLSMLNQKNQLIHILQMGKIIAQKVGI